MITQYHEWNNTFCLMKFQVHFNGFKKKCSMQTAIRISHLLLTSMDNQLPILSINKDFALKFSVYCYLWWVRISLSIVWQRKKVLDSEKKLVTAKISSWQRKKVFDGETKSIADLFSLSLLFFAVTTFFRCHALFFAVINFFRCHILEFLKPAMLGIIFVPAINSDQK